MIHLTAIGRENYRECLELKPAENQKAFIAENVYTLAQAYVYRDVVEVYGIYDDQVMVGLTMMVVYQEKDDYYLWRFMIDERYQRKGYGKAAMRLVLDRFIEKGAKKIALDYVPDNLAAEQLYESFGFVRTGLIADGEMGMELILN